MRPRRKRRRRVISGKAFVLCVAGGVLVGGFMIWAHIGPGIRQLPPPNTPGNRNLWRAADINQIGQALVTYYHDNGSLPYRLSSHPTQICTDMGTPCTSQHFADLGYLMTEGDYLPGIPQDPGDVTTHWGSGFDIANIGANEIKISAPDAELGKTISATFKL